MGAGCSAAGPPAAMSAAPSVTNPSVKRERDIAAGSSSRVPAPPGDRGSVPVRAEELDREWPCLVGRATIGTVLPALRAQEAMPCAVEHVWLVRLAERL